MPLFMIKNYRLIWWDFLSLLNWIGFLTLSLFLQLLLRTLQTRFASLFHLMLFYISCFIWTYMEYCCHFWIGVPNCYLDILCKLQERTCKAVAPNFATSLESLSLVRIWPVLSVLLVFDRCPSELAELFPIRFSYGRPTRCSARLDELKLN